MLNRRVIFEKTATSTMTQNGKQNFYFDPNKHFNQNPLSPNTGTVSSEYSSSNYSIHCLTQVSSQIQFPSSLSSPGNWIPIQSQPILHEQSFVRAHNSPTKDSPAKSKIIRAQSGHRSSVFYGSISITPTLLNYSELKIYKIALIDPTHASNLRPSPINQTPTSIIIIKTNTLPIPYYKYENEKFTAFLPLTKIINPFHFSCALIILFGLYFGFPCLKHKRRKMIEFFPKTFRFHIPISQTFLMFLLFFRLGITNCGNNCGTVDTYGYDQVFTCEISTTAFTSCPCPSTATTLGQNVFLRDSSWNFISFCIYFSYPTRLSTLDSQIVSLSTKDNPLATSITIYCFIKFNYIII